MADLFSDEIDREDKTSRMLLSLIEIGNTIDGVIIGNKILDRRENE